MFYSYVMSGLCILRRGGLILLLKDIQEMESSDSEVEDEEVKRQKRTCHTQKGK